LPGKIVTTGLGFGVGPVGRKGNITICNASKWKLPVRNIANSMMDGKVRL
jgi:hypothetical protein